MNPDHFDVLWCEVIEHQPRIAADRMIYRRPEGNAVPACRECWAAVVFCCQQRAERLGTRAFSSPRRREAEILSDDIIDDKSKKL